MYISSAKADSAYFLSSCSLSLKSIASVTAYPTASADLALNWGFVVCMVSPKALRVVLVKAYSALPLGSLKGLIIALRLSFPLEFGAGSAYLSMVRL